MTPLPPGATIGILGGGQLGRMLALAAARIGFDVHIFAPEADGPAERVSARATIAPYDDLEAVARFAAACDVVTYEFENVPLPTAQEAAKHAPLRPGLRALEISQDRVSEKEFANSIGAETVVSDLTYDLRGGEPDFLDKMIATTFATIDRKSVV